MRIKALNVRNFRGFEQRTFEFDEKLVVIVGNNTAGKTTILQAIQVALGAYLKSLKALPSDAAYQHNFSKEDAFCRFSEEKRDFFKNPDSTRIDVEVDFPVRFFEAGIWDTLKYRSISWWRELKGKQTSHSRKCAGELIDCVEEMEQRRQTDGQNAVYPLVLSFGVNRIDNQYRTANKTKVRESKIARGYKSALKETVDFQSAFDWLYKFEQNLKKNSVFEGNDIAFLKALEVAIPALSDISIDSKNHELVAKVSVTDCKPEYQSFEHMSDGLKAMICMVAEIAHRCIELNDFLGEDAVRETPGIVIVDELDLYLHPRWQRHILEDLGRAFPLIQFIVTSHSPFIIQSVRSANVITLDGSKDVTDPLFRSIEEIAIQEMNMQTRRSVRFEEMQKKAEKYYQLVAAGRGTTAEASQLSQELDEIEREFSDDPAYVAMLRAERSTR